MKRYSVLLTVAFALSFAQGLRAQHLTTTDVPRILSYQGHITNADQAVTGVHPITIRLYSDPEGKHKLWEDTYTTDIKDGIFSVALGTRTPLPETRLLDRPVWLGVSVSGTDELRPLTQFTSAPYALNVPDKSITKAKLSEDLQTLMTKPIGGQDKQVVTWDVGAQSVTSGDKLGSTNNADWNIVVNNLSAFELRPGYSGGSPQAPTVIGGWGNVTLVGTGNSEEPDGVFIGGGGTQSEPNTTNHSEFSTIAGGRGNSIGIISGGTNYHYQTISGGEANHAEQDHSTVSGGKANHAFELYSTVGGGYNNYASGEASVIPGGRYLKIGDNSFGFSGQTSSTTQLNLSSNSQIAVFNDVDLWLGNTQNASAKLRLYEPNNAVSYTSVNFNTLTTGSQSIDINYTLPTAQPTTDQVLSATAITGTGPYAVTLGWADGGGSTNWKLVGNAGLTDGTNNLLGTTSSIPIRVITNNTERARVLSTGEVGIGTSTPSTLTHLLLSNATTNAVDNVLTIGHNSTGTGANGLGLGINFQLESSTTNNRGAAQLKVFWKDASDATRQSTYDLLLADNNDPQRVWRIEMSGGGTTNILGGHVNNNVSPSNVYGATISGGGNEEFPNSVTDIWGTVAGGVGNQAGDAVAGALSASYTTIGGGVFNSATESYATVGGGGNNVASGDGTTIPGGEDLIAQSYGQTVIGRSNKAQGTSTKPITNPVTTINGDDRIFIIGNGLPEVQTTPLQRSNAYEVSNNGHSIVYHNNTLNTNPAIKGARYIDNTTVAWGHVHADGTMFKGFACTSVPPTGNMYTITLNYTDPYTGSQVNLANGGSAIVATLIDSGTDGDPHCGFITVSAITYTGGVNKFNVWTWKANGSCDQDLRDFMFHVNARP